MKNFVFIITNTAKDNLHVGISSDLAKTMNFYKDIPTLFYDGRKLSHLVYAEEYTSEETALARFKEISSKGKSFQIELIESVNPEWMEFVF